LTIKQERKDLDQVLRELAKRFGISVTDIYSKLTAEKTKNDILKGREEAKKRMEAGN